MKTIMRKFALPAVVLLTTTAFTACPPKPGPTPGPVPPSPVADATVNGDDGGPDASDDVSPGPVVSSCALACAALAAANCPHGSLTYCAATLTRILGDGKIANPQHPTQSLTCDDIAKVRTADDARALKFTCP